MNQYIKKDKVLSLLGLDHNDYVYIDKRELAKKIEKLKGIDAVEVVHGEWIDEADKYDASFGRHDYRCSNCNSHADEYIGGHEWYTAGKPNFCPNCGARMKSVDDE